MDPADDLVILDRLESDMLAVETALAELDAVTNAEPPADGDRRSAILACVPASRFGDDTSDERAGDEPTRLGEPARSGYEDARSVEPARPDGPGGSAQI